MTAVLLFVAASCIAAGCTSPPATTKANYSATFSRSLESAGFTPVNPMSQIAYNVYSGSYETAGSNGAGVTTYNITTEVAKSEGAARERYGLLVQAKQNEGYTTKEGGAVGISVFGDTKASWCGYKANGPERASTDTFVYAYNSDIGHWVVVTLFADTSSQHV